MEIFTAIIGYLAAAFGTAIMLPQVYKSYKTHKVDDISKTMIIVYIINCSLWEVYGMLLHQMPIILCNLIAFLIGCFQLWQKYKYTK